LVSRGQLLLKFLALHWDAITKAFTLCCMMLLPLPSLTACTAYVTNVSCQLLFLVFIIVGDKIIIIVILPLTSAGFYSTCVDHGMQGCVCSKFQIFFIPNQLTSFIYSICVGDHYWVCSPINEEEGTNGDKIIRA